MKRKTKEILNSVALGVVISIPIIICRVQASQPSPEEGVRRPSKQEIEIEIAKNTATEETESSAEYLEPYYGYSFMTWPDETDVEAETEAETEPETEAPFSGYEFIPLDADLQVQIMKICEEYEISYDLILAMIKTESNFHTDSIGDDGAAIGLMQIWPQWWQETADANGLNIYEPIDNVNLGIIILNKALNDNGGDLKKALKQYNSGDPNFHSDVYVNTVFEHYQWIEEQAGG